MELRRPPQILSVTAHRKCTWKRISIISIFVLLYACSFQFGAMTIGEPREWALNEQRRIIRDKAKKASKEGIVMEKSAKKSKGNLENLQIDEDDIPSAYLPNAWACLCIFLTVCMQILFHLLCHWSLSFKAMMLYESVRNEDDVYNEKTCIFCLPPSAKGQGEINNVQENEFANYSFMFQNQKYELVEDDDDADLIGDAVIGCRLVQSSASGSLEQYRAATGLLNEEDIEAALELYGSNVFELPMPTFLDLFWKQLGSPIVIFQLFCAFLWMVDTYWKYTMFTLLTILGFEASTAFQRLKQMQSLRGMGAKTYNVNVYRKKRWTEVNITELLPGDLVSLCVNKISSQMQMIEGAVGGDKKKTQFDLTVPCDCVILQGTAVVNEASLTGESVPQMKDAIPATDSDKYDMQGKDRIHTLFSGTSLIQSQAAAGSTRAGEDGFEIVEDATLKPPDNGIVCYVLRTGFSSSQGELMRMIEFSQENVTADKKETAMQLLLLLAFALCAAGYVLKKGLEDPERPTYKVLLRCIIILTSVVPASLPMQMAFAVHTALMNLMKAGIFCTEPFRVPEAGKLQYCFFDKTGTLTSDQMHGTGIVLPDPKTGKFKENCETVTELMEAHVIKMRQAENHNMATMILAGCQALIEVNQKLCGDPIEMASLKGIEWSFKVDAKDGSATTFPGTSVAKECALETAKEIAEKEMDDAKQKQLKKDVAELEKQLEAEKKKAKEVTITVLNRYHFASKLQRMSTICNVSSGPNKGVHAFAKGSPEAILKLLDKSLLNDKKFVESYNKAYRALAEKGQRVLALGYRNLTDKKFTSANADTLRKVPREDVEKDLHFAGFSTYKCETRRDTKLVIQSLNDAAHKCIMLTGDATLTAYSVAKEVDIARLPAADALVLDDKAEFWTPALASVEAEPVKFDARKLKVLSEKHDLVISGLSVEAAAEKWGEEFWENSRYVCTFARMKPQQKEEVIRCIGGQKHADSTRYGTLMCGDGGNDVGALKQADVGVALLSGFGNANVDVKTKNLDESLFESENQLETYDNLSPEDRLFKMKQDEQKRMQETQKKIREEFTGKQKHLIVKQQKLVEEEMERRRQAGEDVGVMAHVAVMQKVMAGLKEDMMNEQKSLQKQHQGGVFNSDPGSKWFEALEQDAEDKPTIRLGDASIAAPFTSRTPSIGAVVDVIRQGRCTLLSAVQQMQIMMLDSMISAYSMSVMSADGARSSEAQMMASGTLISVAHIAFSFARPLDRMHPAKPLASVFHPATFSSLMGQIAIHLFFMVYITDLAVEAMGPEKVKEIIQFEKDRNKQIDAMEEDQFSDFMWFMKVPFKPNLLNTMVWLIQSAQQIGVLFVNYKGRPWMKGMLENQALCLSLVGCIALVFVCAFEIFKPLNDILQLETVPLELRWKLIGALFCSIFGTFVWDRLMMFVFARDIFWTLWNEITSTKFIDLVPLLKTVGMGVGGVVVLGSGNPLLWVGAYYWYQHFFKEKTEEEKQKEAAAGNINDAASASSSSGGGAELTAAPKRKKKD